MKRMPAVMLAMLVIIVAGEAHAQSNYPEKPVRIVVGFPPGSPVDVVARLFGKKFTEAWGKPVVIDNVIGAAGNIGADRVAKAAPDGYTLGLLSNAQLVIGPSLYKLAYEPVNDFVPVSQVISASSANPPRVVAPSRSPHRRLPGSVR
jgi:tripartite-type tricarboxylate transporter receptor subunit TctC